METEYSSYRLGMGELALHLAKRQGVFGKGYGQGDAAGPGRLGFAAIALNWQRPFLGPLHAWSSAIERGKQDSSSSRRCYGSSGDG